MQSSIFHILILGLTRMASLHVLRQAILARCPFPSQLPFAAGVNAIPPARSMYLLFVSFEIFFQGECLVTRSNITLVQKGDTRISCSLRNRGHTGRCCIILLITVRVWLLCKSRLYFVFNSILTSRLLRTCLFIIMLRKWASAPKEGPAGINVLRGSKFAIVKK
jgi:hypothetical protein